MVGGVYVEGVRGEFNAKLLAELTLRGRHGVYVFEGVYCQ
jgi:hypothetical protein